MKQTFALAAQQRRYEDAVAVRDAVSGEVQALDESASATEVDRLVRAFDCAEERVELEKAAYLRRRNLDEARQRIKMDETTTPRVHVEREPSVYRPDGKASFFADLLRHRTDPGAFERLHRSQREIADAMRVEERDITTSTSSSGGYFIPQMTMAEWIELPRSGRPFAAAIPNRLLPAVGMSLVFPAVSTGTAVA